MCCIGQFWDHRDGICQRSCSRSSDTTIRFCKHTWLSRPYGRRPSAIHDKDPKYLQQPVPLTSICFVLLHTLCVQYWNGCVALYNTVFDFLTFALHFSENDRSPKRLFWFESCCFFSVRSLLQTSWTIWIESAEYYIWTSGTEFRCSLLLSCKTVIWNNVPIWISSWRTSVFCGWRIFPLATTKIYEDSVPEKCVLTTVCSNTLLLFIGSLNCHVRPIDNRKHNKMFFFPCASVTRAFR